MLFCNVSDIMLCFSPSKKKKLYAWSDSGTSRYWALNFPLVFSSTSFCGIIPRQLSQDLWHPPVRVNVPYLVYQLSLPGNHKDFWSQTIGTSHILSCQISSGCHSVNIIDIFPSIPLPSVLYILLSPTLPIPTHPSLYHFLCPSFLPLPSSFSPLPFSLCLCTLFFSQYVHRLILLTILWNSPTTVEKTSLLTQP